MLLTLTACDRVSYVETLIIENPTDYDLLVNVLWKEDGTKPPPVLTPEGRELLVSRSRLLLERLKAFETPQPGQIIDPQTANLFESALNEFVQLGHAIHSSTSVENVPDDPKLVELGDDVVISSGVGRVERCFGRPSTGGFCEGHCGR